MTCREAVNDCDIPETCTGDSSQVSEVCGDVYQDAKNKYSFENAEQAMTSLLQCPHNVHKLDGYMCDVGQVKLLHFRKHISFAACPFFFSLIISNFLLRVVVMEVAVRPETASAGLCGATVRLDTDLHFSLLHGLNSIDI